MMINAHAQIAACAERSEDTSPVDAPKSTATHGDKVLPPAEPRVNGGSACIVIANSFLSNAFLTRSGRHSESHSDLVLCAIDVTGQVTCPAHEETRPGGATSSAAHST